jgi:transposase InsO family protein
LSSQEWSWPSNLSLSGCGSGKYEDIYLKNYASVLALEQRLQTYFRFYNQERLHQSLNYQTPVAVHFAAIN